jgi:hypothetical protein
VCASFGFLGGGLDACGGGRDEDGGGGRAGAHLGGCEETDGEMLAGETMESE